MVNAEAIAMISLKKNSPNDAIGKGFFSLVPNLCVKALSFMRLVVVFTTKVIISFKIDGSTPLTFMWSARLDEIYVDV